MNWNLKMSLPWSGSGRTRAGCWGCCRTSVSLSTNGRVWTEGQKHIHQAAAISKQTQSVRLSWLQGCSPGSLQMSVSKRQQMFGEWHTGENSLFPACPCCQPTGHTQERSPSPNTVGKGCQHCRAECLEVWRCLSKGCLCSLNSSTPEALSVLKGRTARAHWTSCCSYIYFMLSLFCLFPFFIFLVALQTLTWTKPNYPCLSWSFLSLLLCTSSSEWDLVCRILGTPIKQGLLTLLYKLVDIDTYIHFEHSLWASGPAFSSSVCGQKCWVQKMDLTNLICRSWCLSPLEIWIQSLSHPSKPEQHPGSNSIWEIWLKKGLKNGWTRTFDKGLEW